MTETSKDGLAKAPTTFWKKRRVVLGAAALLLSLVPLPLRDQDRKVVVTKSVYALKAASRVVQRKWNGRMVYEPLNPAQWVPGRKLLYDNQTGIDDRVFESLGLQAYSGELEHADKDAFYEKNMILEFNHRNHRADAKDERIHFGCWYGPVGGEGYRLLVYRNFWGCFVFYISEWVS